MCNSDHIRSATEIYRGCHQNASNYCAESLSYCLDTDVTELVSRPLCIIPTATDYRLQTLYNSVLLQESCQTLPRFCFPYDIQRWVSLYGVPSACLFFSLSTSRYIHLLRVRDGVAVQHFTFVLTDLEGSQRFGFCRLTTSTHTCLCILRYIRAKS